ncbi:MAG: glycosyltransferase, partial [Desulfobacula sp.]|nr:glycosyltransferase [Desulfobacula sp.]
MKRTVVFALDSYMPRTFTWVYNQLRFLKDIDILILANMLDPDRKHFPLNQHKLFSFPGLEVLKNPGIPSRIFRRLLRLILIDSRLDLLVFAWKAKRSGCSLIHAHFANTGWKFIPVARMLRVPLAVAFYGFDYDYLPNTQPEWKRRYWTLFKYGTLFLTEGEYGRARLIEKGLSPDKVKVYHLGIDVDGIPFRIRSLKQGAVLRIVQVASIVKKKGQKIAIEALRVLKEKGYVQNVSLVLIGNGPLKQILIGLVRKYHLDQYVSFIDHIPYEDLHQELLKYHVFVHPSVTTPDGDCEGGAPVVLLDAQATGMPIISTYHCDIPEEVIDGKTGALVPENDHNALDGAILLFLKNSDILGHYGTA